MIMMFTIYVVVIFLPYEIMNQGNLLRGIVIWSDAAWSVD
jgi:hypothetical protein